VYWSEFLESVRKDVERTFGILKIRFAFLKNAVQYHSQEMIQCAVWTACALHNMLLDYDEEWGRVDWSVIDGAEDGDGEALMREEADDIFEHGEEEEGPLYEGQHCGGLGIIPPTYDAAVVEYAPRHYNLLMDALVAHFKYCFERGSVVWSRGFGVDKRLHFPMRRRHPNDLHNCLYRAPSSYRGRDASGMYTVDIGLALYSTRAYKEGQKIAKFVGTIYEGSEYEIRYIQFPDERGYTIRLPCGKVLDCYHHRDECFASIANCYRLLRSRGPGGACGIENARWSWSAKKQTLNLRAKIYIARYREIMWDYGTSKEYVNRSTGSAAPTALKRLNIIQ
jgi:hypothetical protein